MHFWSQCCSQREAREEVERWTLPSPKHLLLHLGPLRTSSSMISSSWPIMKSNWLWLSSIINESNGSLHFQTIWQMALSIYCWACHSGSFSERLILWNLVIKGFALQAFSRFWHSLCYFFFLWLWQNRNNQVILLEFIFPPYYEVNKTRKHTCIYTTNKKVLWLR